MENSVTGNNYSEPLNSSVKWKCGFFNGSITARRSCWMCPAHLWPCWPRGWVANSSNVRNTGADGLRAPPLLWQDAGSDSCDTSAGTRGLEAPRAGSPLCLLPARRDGSAPWMVEGQSSWLRYLLAHFQRSSVLVIALDSHGSSRCPSHLPQSSPKCRFIYPVWERRSAGACKGKVCCLHGG